MNDFLNDLASRRRFGMKPGLDTIRSLLTALGHPEERVPVLHIAGTNGKGAVAAMLEACLRQAGLHVGRYTSPHLSTLNERFFLDGRPVSDARLEQAAATVRAALPADSEVTFFEALTAVAFSLYAAEHVDFAVMETGLGGRLDAVNVCHPVLTVITRIGLDHCDWLGETVEKIAQEKAGILKPGVPVVLGANALAVQEVVRREAERVGAPYFYAPDRFTPDDIPETLTLKGPFNRENAVTALAAQQVLEGLSPACRLAGTDGLRRAFGSVVWPGRFQRVGGFLIDGAHNPPAAQALADGLCEEGVCPRSLDLVVGFCADKDFSAVIDALAPFARRVFAVRTNNPRSLQPEDLATRLRARGLEAMACASLGEALSRLPPDLATRPVTDPPQVLVCGSLFLAGEALVALKALPWSADRLDPSEQLAATMVPDSRRI